MRLQDITNQHINLTLWRHEESLYLAIAVKTCASTLNMEDLTA